ncbi:MULTISPECIES: terpene synthase family protein [unclassified Streptomyces]|uniref:terpene synthase family protein n=1 Tax=unclassified Streptomyces TaxID=2593676 RepID=UPI000DC766EC|nr:MULTISPECIES: terpene synthase family protein [unclassified Streptomyces]AWZ06651.1 hypothetical protein DRB89_20780 [Streptomyces sp. ICC4]AWZ14378.1 hypothetical protein DRB96_21275 [Streptomyces sp. ICC1]
MAHQSSQNTASAVLPPVYCPIERAFHPKAASVQNRAFDWIERHRLFGDAGIPRESALATDSARVTGSMMPGAPEDLLLLYATYVYWGFSVDDLFDTGTTEERTHHYRTLAPRLMRAVESPAAQADDDGPHVALLLDMRRYLERCATPAQVRLWVDTIHAWLLGVALELDSTRDQSLPGVNDYLFVRMYVGAARAVTVTLEICGGGEEIPAQERESTAVTALTQAAGVLMNLYQDLFSHHKEGPTDHNIINVLTHATGSSQQQARVQAVELCDRIMVLFLRLREQTAPRVSAPTRTYLDNLGHALSGVLDWCHTTARYKTGTTTAPVRAEQPSAPGLAPPPYPNIAWWWDQLDQCHT